MRQRRIQHWSLSGPHLEEAETPVIGGARASFALDEHEQVKVLSDKNWRGQWGSVTLWRNGEFGVVTSGMMEFLSRLTVLAQQLAPAAARALLQRSEAVDAAAAMLPR